MNLKRCFFAFAIGAAVCLTGCQKRPAEAAPSAMEPVPSSSLPAVQEEIPEREIVSRSVLLAVGDNLIHDTLYRQAKTTGDNPGYDFKPMYERVKKQIEAADIAFINQETMMAKSLQPSSYPLFNTPPEMASDLREVGFDLLSIANNHMLDKGVGGLEETLELINSTDGLTVAGGFASAQARERTAVIESNGIRFAFVAFTQHTNGIPLPAGREYMLVYTDDSAEITRQIAQAKKQADVVVASVHWGEENTHQPTEYQQIKAKELADAGADIILGTHPHVLQPIAYIEAADGRRVPVIYSLGNFVSGQIDSANLLGGMLEIAVEKNQSTGEIKIERPLLTPVVTHYESGMRNLSLYPLSDYTEELAARHGVRIGYGRRFDMEYLNAILTEVIDPQYLAGKTQ